MIAKVVIHSAELVIPTEIATNKADAEIETPPVTFETKTD